MDSIDISDIYVQSKTIKQLLLFFSLPFFSFVLGGLIFIPSVCNALFFLYDHQECTRYLKLTSAIREQWEFVRYQRYFCVLSLTLDVWSGWSLSLSLTRAYKKRWRLTRRSSMRWCLSSRRFSVHLFRPQLRLYLVVCDPTEVCSSLTL